MSVHDDVIVFRKRLVAVIEASSNRRLACRRAGIHHSTFYRWRRSLDEPVGPYRGLSVADRMIEEQIVAVALAYPAEGPLRVVDRLRIIGVEVSASKVWRTLKRHNLNSRRLRYQLLHQHRSEVPSITVSSRSSEYVGELDATVPGDLVQMDCFHVGSFKETRIGANKNAKGQIWQYTAIDVASSYLWAELAMTRRNPEPALTTALALRVANDLTNYGWPLKTISTDNGNEFVADQFITALTDHGITHRRIKAGRPQSNGKVERVQGTILEELYQPALIGYIEPSISGLRRDLDTYLEYYNNHRPHHGKWNKGTPPLDIIQPKTKLIP